MQAEQAERLETAIDRLNADLHPLTSFILPGRHVRQPPGVTWAAPFAAGPMRGGNAARPRPSIRK